MALNFLSLQDHILDLIDVDDATTRAFVKDYINISARDIWTAHAWPERYTEGTVTTVAPYSTGTVSSSGTAIAGSGTTFPTSIVEGLTRFAKSYSDPWYVISDRASATAITLADSYNETALSGSAYTIYQDIYNLASDVDEVVDVRLLKASEAGSLASTLERRMDEAVYIPGQAGTPRVYSLVGQSSVGLKRIRLWPVPDTTLRLKYRYLKSYTDMQSDGDKCVIPESRRDILIAGTLRYAYRLKGEDNKANTQEGLFRRLLEEHWAREKDKASVPARLLPFDARGGRYVDPWDISTLSIS